MRFTLLVLLALSSPSLATPPATPGVSDPETAVDGHVRITAPGGLILHHRIPADSELGHIHRFQVNAPRKGLNAHDLRILGQVSPDDRGGHYLNGSCVETWSSFNGKFHVYHRNNAPFSARLIQGRIFVQACTGVLVQVLMPASR